MAGPVPTVLLDVDGVIADFVECYLSIANRMYNKAWTPQDITEQQIDRALKLSPPQHEAVLRRLADYGPGALVPYPDAVRSVLALLPLADVYFVTAPLEACTSWERQRMRWLERLLGSWAPRRMLSVHGTAKFLIAGDVLVEDDLETAISWQLNHPEGQALLLDRPWNQSLVMRGVRRIQDLKDVLDVLAQHDKQSGVR